MTFKRLLLTALSLYLYAPHAYALDIVEDQALSFGTFAFGNLTQIMEVTVNTDTTFSSNSNTVIVGDPTRGEYTVTDGTPSATYSISVPTSVTLTGTGPGVLTIDNIVASPDTGVFDGFGVTTMNLGGRLRSSGGGAQYQGGNYTGTINIVINY